jgi:hypothetical protein
MMSELWVDHVIYAVEELDPAAERFRDEFGLASVVGGRHPGWGTANRIVPLGREYVELVAVVDRDEATTSDFGRGVTRAVATGRRLVGWAAATNDLHGIASRLNLDADRGSRTRPDGSTLRWQLAGVAHALATGALPFFIQWDGPRELHPGAAVVDHGVTPRGSRGSRSPSRNSRCTRGWATTISQCGSAKALHRYQQSRSQPANANSYCDSTATADRESRAGATERDLRAIRKAGASPGLPTDALLASA